MNRYSLIPITTTPQNSKPRYINVKYPLIFLDSQDIYVYTTQGDRYDILAQSFYSDSTLWWIINRANPSQDSNSIFPTVGAQIRIPTPSNVSVIISQYETLNRTS
jgi:hypothetical protein